MQEDGVEYCTPLSGEREVPAFASMVSDRQCMERGVSHKGEKGWYDYFSLSNPALKEA